MSIGRSPWFTRPPLGRAPGVLRRYNDALALDLNYAARGALTGRETFTRSSTAWESDGTSFATNIPRFPAGLGLRIEEARTQYLANPATPATQTVTLATGAYVALVKGSGSLAVAAGTATITGAGTATEGSPVVFVVTAGGTVTFTKSGTLTWANVQGGAFATTPILAASASTTRAADSAIITLADIGIPAAPTGLTWLGKGQAYKSDAIFGSLDDGTSSNRIIIYRNPSAVLHALVIKAGTTEADLTLGSITDNTDFSFWVSLAGNDMAGALVGGSTQTASTVSLPTRLTTKRIGAQPSGQVWCGTVAHDVTYTRRLSNADAAARAASL